MLERIRSHGVDLLFEKASNQYFFSVDALSLLTDRASSTISNFIAGRTHATVPRLIPTVRHYQRFSADNKTYLLTTEGGAIWVINFFTSKKISSLEELRKYVESVFLVSTKKVTLQERATDLGYFIVIDFLGELASFLDKHGLVGEVDDLGRLVYEVTSRFDDLIHSFFDRRLESRSTKLLST